MKIEQVELRRLHVPLKAPFETSFGRFTFRDCILVGVSSEGETGYAESVAMPTPYYNEEMTDTVIYLLKHFLIPQLVGQHIDKPEQTAELFASVRRNYMAISALEGAVWDLLCKAQGISLSAALGGTRSEIDVGVSIGIESSVDHVLRNVTRFLEEGYKKIKVKIKPGFDIELIDAIRTRFGADVPLMADANSAYTLEHIPLLKQLDQYGLMMIEQPLAHDDIVDHATLQRELSTPICLDESIHSVEDARKAIELGSCRIINLKIGRVGGLTHTKNIHDLCARHGIPVWCGGMFEMGVGRAHNIAIASMPNFTIPGDTSTSKRHFEEDIVEPAVDFSKPGTLAVPTKPGIGYDLNRKAVEKYTVSKEIFKP
ncbi:o-succinylbenzoate synthase [Paenibacillus sp. GYB004]|uniref:o-succinylbenzoate synthase n=1 Tax=Paenibacillus sp. GYB004 TaxID=2994393 RepID=UPI002F969EEC